MKLPSRAGKRHTDIFFAIILLLSLAPASAQESVIVAVVDDGPSDRLSGQQQRYIDELLALTSTEFSIQIRHYSGAWSKQSIDRAIGQAYSDADVDMVLVTGFVANQIAATKLDFPKPTFLPIILDTGLLARAAEGGGSGIANLSYLSAYADFADDLDTLAKILPFRTLVLFVDLELSSSIPQLRDSAFASSIERGVDLIVVPHDGTDHRLMNRVPANTDAIFIAGLPRMPPPDFARLVDDINAAQLPSYSFMGVADVERGLLVTNSEPRDIDRQARLNALNMQAVMLGERAEDQSTKSQNKEQLTINMATARRIGLSINFDILNDAVLLNQVAEVSGQKYGLVEIARWALEQNQDLQAETFGVQAGLAEIARARANLLPQIGASAQYTLRNDSPTVAAGLLAERSNDAAISLDQLLYSDAAIANLSIQKNLQESRLASLDQFRLDVIQAATVSYYAVLSARSQLAVQENNLRTTRANLELAKDRVRLGTSTQADVYRWQAEEARAQILVLNARSAGNQTWDTLNRILHRPQGTQIALRDATFDEPFVMARAEFDSLIESPADYNRFSLFYIARALRQAPEIAQLDGQIRAKRRICSL